MITVSGVLLKIEISSNPEKPFVRAVLLTEDNEPLELLSNRPDGIAKLLKIKDQVSKEVSLPVNLPRSFKQLWV